MIDGVSPDGLLNMEEPFGPVGAGRHISVRSLGLHRVVS